MTLAPMKTAPHNDGRRCLSYKHCTRKGGGEFTRERVNRLQGAFLSLFQMWRSLLVAAQTVIGLTSAEVQPLGVLHSNTGLAQQQLWLPKNKLCLIRMEPKPSPGPLPSLHVAQRCILQLRFSGSRIHAELQHPCRAAGSTQSCRIRSCCWDFGVALHLPKQKYTMYPMQKHPQQSQVYVQHCIPLGASFIPKVLQLYQMFFISLND